MSHMSAPIFALHPFDNPAVDTVLRCRDGVHFRVRSAILLEASSIFSDMLAAISCPGDSDHTGSDHCVDRKPIIVVVEGSNVIDPLLRLCYPTADPVLKDLQDIRPVLAAAMKYQMEEAIAMLKEALLSYMKTQPLRVWAHASLLHLEKETRKVARTLVEKKLPVEAPKELQEVSAGDYYRLIKILRCRGPEAESVKLFEADPADIQEQPKKVGWWSRAKNGDPLEPFVTFRSRPYADIICRSSDGHDFRAHRIILCLASSVLEDKISALSPETFASASSASGDLPVLLMDVDAKALGGILELCYIESDSLRYRHCSPHYVMSMMVAARTLGMKRVLEGLESDAYPDASWDEPLLGYFLAANAGFTEVAKDLKSDLPRDIFPSGYLPEMESIPAHFYHRLLVRGRRKKAALKAARATKISTLSA